ncbi:MULTISPECIES: hypothetical protein [unclassified Burkholderia]|uniref:hypothetical protein n=1 Tax=unclassified Burkholderia TaxID=2613784 RepID=UPI00075CCACC|nr:MULTISPECIES: hypothetical protein [unclassified Burkholderia]KVN07894.1 hypothetical protein WT08_17325 [Burkholderia sp. MSMB1552]KWZ49497.1 hypothetical protein WS92_18525 [Burkholderia sp. MSMB1588]
MYEKQMALLVDTLERIADDYHGHEQAVLDAIAECEQALEDEREGAIGPWERRELDYARVAVHDGFRRVALMAAEKALIVSQLSRDEYEYGLNYGRSN